MFVFNAGIALSSLENNHYVDLVNIAAATEKGDSKGDKSQ